MLILLILVVCAFVYAGGYCSGLDAKEKEAVSKGYAKYHQSEDGVEFRWNNETD